MAFKPAYVATEAKNLRIEQQSWTPNMQLINAYFSTRQEASKAIYNRDITSDNLELITDDLINWIVERANNDGIRDEMEDYREKEFERIKKVIYKRREYTNQEQWTNNDTSLCWKKACIKTLGLVHKWYGKYLNIDGQENTIGMVSQFNYDPEGKPFVFIGKELIKKLAADNGDGILVGTSAGFDE